MENEIKVGEYCRTDKGQIFKVDENKINIELCKFLDVEYGDIVKHSPNLIDIIECGDYVNGEQITDIWYGNRISSVKSNFNEEDIETIVTKEMMESISYKVKQEEK